MYMPLAMAAPIMGAIAGAWHTLSVDGTGFAAFVLAGGPIPSTNVPLDASSFDSVPIGRESTDERRRDHHSDDTHGNKDVTGKGCGGWWIQRASFPCLVVAIFCGVSLSATHLTPSFFRNWRNKELLWSNTVRIFPGSETAHTNLVSVYQKRGPRRDLDKALYHARRAVEICPLVPKYWHNLVQILNVRNEPSEIRNFLKDRLIMLPGDNYWAKALHLSMGKSLKRLGEIDQAEKEFEIAAKLGDRAAKSELSNLRRLKESGNKVKMSGGRRIS